MWRQEIRRAGSHLVDTTIFRQALSRNQQSEWELTHAKDAKDAKRMEISVPIKRH
jgi:hypothetical protein